MDADSVREWLGGEHGTPAKTLPAELVDLLMAGYDLMTIIKLIQRRRQRRGLPL